MKNFPVKASTFAMVSALALTTLSSAAQQTDYSRALRELNIMANIFEATLDEERKNNGFAFASSSPDSVYLANQGMVFTFNVRIPWYSQGDFNNFNRNFNFNFNDLDIDLKQIERKINAMSEAMKSFPDIDIDLDFDVDIPSSFPALPYLNAYYQIVGQNANAQREIMDRMNQTIREKQRAIQDVQREMRARQRDIRNNRGDIDTEEEEIARLEQRLNLEMAALDEQSDAYEQFIGEYEAQRKEQVASFNKQASDLIITTLCDYGATLRSLQNGEYVTVIFENYTDDLDQVYVFNYEDIASCNSLEELLKDAVSYQI